MSESTAGDLGGRLREARERRGITLRQIASVTKISLAALEALERNDFARLPGGLFSRAFVRSYATQVGLDPEETVQQFIAQFPYSSVTAGHPTAGTIEDNEAVESDRRMASMALRLVMISLPVAGLVLYYGAQGARRAPLQEPAAPVAEATAGTSNPAGAPGPMKPEEPLPVATGSADAGTAFPPLVDAPRAPAAGRLAVGLSAAAPCWVSAVVDGQQVLRRELKPGEKHMFDVQRNFVISLGDAAAVRLTLNGAAARPLGGPGQVLEALRINPTNFTDFLATP
jgi:transcriptional regulator with XRE-family HTH domain